jgi:uncharacterized phage-associated protein
MIATVADVFQVANYLIELSEENRFLIDHMKLQKLAYIAHGWHLAITGRPLFENRIEAWKYGPIIPDLYWSFKRFGHTPITKQSIVDAGIQHAVDCNLEDEQSRQIVKRVWEQYKKFSGLNLSTMTHADGTPWQRTPLDGMIDDELIKSHYQQLARKRNDER